MSNNNSDACLFTNKTAIKLQIHMVVEVFATSARACMGFEDSGLTSKHQPAIK